MALLRRLLEERQKLGIVLSIVHVHHGIRGAAADQDAAFVGGLAAAHDLIFHLHRTDAAVAAANLHETLEEAARNLRYAFFGELMADKQADAVATAHTLDDQAETVLPYCSVTAEESPLVMASRSELSLIHIYLHEPQDDWRRQRH